MRILQIKEKLDYGYKWTGMVAIDKDLARVIYAAGKQEVYKLYESNAEGLVDSKDDLEAHHGLFGVEIV